MSVKIVTTHDLQIAPLMQEWVDPIQAEKDRLETKKRLELDELRETLTRIQQRIAELEKELNHDSD